MIHIVCALPSEAKPLISYYGLEFCSHGCPYKIYRSDSMALIISGVGKVRTAAAVSYLAMFQELDHPALWLNIGIGGTRNVQCGTGFLANKITDRSSQKSFYPSIVFDVPCRQAEVVTVDRPDSNHQDGIVFDMEASGFFHTAILFSQAELIHSYKVISDFDEVSIKKVTRELVSELIEKQIPEIELIIGRLSALVDDHTNLEEVYQTITSERHFSVTESIQLKRVLDRWEACRGDQSLDMDVLSQLKTARDVIIYIDKLIHSTPLSFS